MPIHLFQCLSGHRSEELFLGQAEIPDAVICPHCGQPAQRQVAVRIHVGGYSMLQLEQLEQAHFTPKERAAAYAMRRSSDSKVRQAGEKGRFNCASDVAKFESAMGIRRLDPHGKELRVMQEDMLDEHRMLEVATEQDGVDGAHALIDRLDIQGKTGMSDATFARWKSMTEKVDERIKRGDFPEPTSDGGTSSDDV